MDSYTHNFDVPAGDALLHSGDLTNTGTVSEFKKTMDWLYSLPHKVKIIVAGNHDLTLHEGWYEDNWQRWHKAQGIQEREPIIAMLKGPKARKAGLFFTLRTNSMNFKPRKAARRGLYMVLLPWSPEFWNWAFNYKEQEAEGPALVGKYVCPKTDILLIVTHGPPFHILDLTTGHDFAGCKTLTSHLPSLRPRLHLFGHIHEAHGAHIHTWTPSTNGFESPRVQNSDSAPPEFEMGISDTDTNTTGVDCTVFVNAANWPAGSRATEFLTNSKDFGGPGFRPIVADLLE